MEWSHKTHQCRSVNAHHTCNETCDYCVKNNNEKLLKCGLISNHEGKHRCLKKNHTTTCGFSLLNHRNKEIVAYDLNGVVFAKRIANTRILVIVIKYETRSCQLKKNTQLLSKKKPLTGNVLCMQPKVQSSTNAEMHLQQ